MRTAAVVNLKGGVGKSTTAINLALIMATVYKYRVLLVDNDIQANVSKFFGVHSYDYKSMENVLRDTDTMAEDVIRSSGRVGLDIIPANMNMDAAAVDLMLDQEANQIVRLKDVLDQVEEQYDYCLIDCPPGVGINVLNALAAADDVIIPIKADKNALDGMEELTEVIEEIRPYNPGLSLVKCLVTMFTNDISVVKGEEALLCFPRRYDRTDKLNSSRRKEGRLMEVPKEWKGTPEEWNAVVEAFGRIAKAIQEAGRQIVNSFSELYKRMAAAMGNEQAKKRLRQQSIRDRKKQLERSRKRQQLAAANTDKSNNWRRLHGLCTRRKYKKHAKKN